QGAWDWFGNVVGPALAAGPDALIDDDVAYVRPWGFDPASIAVPVLFVHGGRDLMVPCSHSVWLASHCQNAELRLSPDDGHISILRSAEAALEWLRQRVPS
ncbi:MAG TPA: alpha/beta hydrolase, partial [Acidimicrobiales bacterium]|nr:alpha/beta hydrolase [Acidimicrobiales bacterium]